MSKPKKQKSSLPKMSKQEQRRAEQERQKKKTLFIIIGTVVIIVLIFTLLFMMASKDSAKNKDTSGTAFNYSEMLRMGQADAPVKVVEFGDFKCPACAQFTGEIKPKIVQDYVETGTAAFYFVNMNFIGPDSKVASLAALSVYHQNQEAFWKYYDAIYANQGPDEHEEWATEDFLVDLAKKEKLDIDFDLLRKDIQERTYAADLQRDLNIAADARVESTPTVYINGKKTEDAFNYANISSEIEAAAKVVSNE